MRRSRRLGLLAVVATVTGGALVPWTNGADRGDAAAAPGLARRQVPAAPQRSASHLDAFRAGQSERVSQMTCEELGALLPPDTSPLMTREEHTWRRVGEVLYIGLEFVGIPGGPGWPRVVEAGAWLDPMVGLTFAHRSGVQHGPSGRVLPWAAAYPGTLADELRRALEVTPSRGDEALTTFDHPYAEAWARAAIPRADGSLRCDAPEAASGQVP